MVRAKRLPASVSVSKSALENATSTLQGLPEKPKENWSLREAVSVLQESISAALGKGYSYEEVAKMLSERNVEISASSLKSYLSAAKRQKGTAASKGRKTGQRPTESQGSEVSLNGSTPAAATLNNSKLVLNQLEIVPDLSEVELPAKQPTRRKTKAAAPQPTAPTARKTAAKAKTTAQTTTKTAPKTVSKTKTTPKSTSSRGRKKSD
jgi:hypothetical protein